MVNVRMIMKILHCFLSWVLMSVCAAGGMAAEEELLPDLCYRSNGVYSVLEAAEFGNLEILKARLQEKANPNQRDVLGNTPLHLAGRGGHAACVRLLLKSGADVMAKNTAGQIPAVKAQGKQVKDILQKAEKKRIKEIELCRKLSAGDSEMLMQAMKQKGFNPNILAEDNTNSLLMLACRVKNVEAVKKLLQSGADVHYADNTGHTVLHVAVSTNCADVVKEILAAGANPMAQAHNLATPLHDTVWSFWHESLKIILPEYKKINFSPWGEHNGYPIQLAIDLDNRKAVEQFLKMGFNPNDSRFKKVPLLIYACKKNKVEIVKMLLAAGADETVRDAHGKSVRDYASAEILSLLKS